MPEISIKNLINNFSQLDASRQMEMANQLAFDLIELASGRKTLQLTTPLDNTQTHNLRHIIYLMIFQESQLNQQIDDWAMRARYIDSVPHAYPNFFYINPIYNDYFFVKKAKLFSANNEPKALVIQSENLFTLNPTIQFGQALTANWHWELLVNIIMCQRWRITCIAYALSQNFLQMFGQSFAVLQPYTKEEQYINTWRNFLAFTSPFFMAGFKKSPIDDPGIFFFHLALHFEDQSIFLKWLELGGSLAKLDELTQRKSLQLAIRSNNKQLLVYLLTAGVTPQQADVMNAPKQIADFLNYRPGRNPARGVFNSILQESSLPGKNLDVIKRMIEDEANTSDEESSDEEADDFRQINVINPINKVCLVRGNNFIPQHFNAEKRREARQEHFHRQPVYSHATRNLANRLPRAANNTINFKHADDLVKSFFEMLKLTPDKPELNENFKKMVRTQGGNQANFESLYMHFIQAYVNTYGDLFNQGGMARNFNFFNSDNPIVSTSANFKVGFMYGSGAWINHSLTFFGKVRRSTGNLKHRRLGYIQVYLIDANYLQKHSANIDALCLSGKIALSHRLSFGKETIIESSIPAEYILGYQIISMPKMNGPWTPHIQQQYGLTQIEYSNFKLSLYQGVIDKNIIAKVIEHQSQCLEKRIFSPQPVEQPNNLAESFNKLKL